MVKILPCPLALVCLRREMAVDSVAALGMGNEDFGRRGDARREVAFDSGC